MADMPRITITKRVSLAGLSEGWDDCYAIVAPARYRDYEEVSQLETSMLTQAQLIKTEMDLVKSHLVAGKIKVHGDDNFVDLEPADIESSLELSNRIYSEIMGFKLDPKGTDEAAGSEPKRQNSTSTTETTSSTVSPEQSPLASSETSASSDTGNTSDSRTTTP